MYIRYNYADARKAWGKVYCDTLWFRLGRDDAHVCVAPDEDAVLSSRPSLSAPKTQTVIAAIIKRYSECGR